MSSVTENPRTGDFLLSEGNGTISRENEILASGQHLLAGAVLGQLTVGGKFTALAPAATDGSQTAAAILWDNTDAAAADTAVVVIARDAEVKADALVWSAGITANQKTTAIAQLAELGIVLR